MGRTLDNAASDEGRAITNLESYRTERPVASRVSRGHGAKRDLTDIGARLPDKKPVKPLAVPVAPIMPKFLEELLARKAK